MLEAIGFVALMTAVVVGPFLFLDHGMHDYQDALWKEYYEKKNKK